MTGKGVVHKNSDSKHVFYDTHEVKIQINPVGCLGLEFGMFLSQLVILRYTPVHQCAPRYNSRAGQWTDTVS